MILKRYRFGDAFSKISLFTIKPKNQTVWNQFYVHDTDQRGRRIKSLEAVKSYMKASYLTMVALKIGRESMALQYMVQGQLVIHMEKSKIRSW